MGKSLGDDTLDGALNIVKNNATRQVLCSAEPANYAGVAAVTLATQTIDSSDFTGPADGDTSGRKLTVNEQTGVSISSTGTANHVAYTNGTDTLYAVTTITGQSVTSGNTATVGAHDIEIADPS